MDTIKINIETNAEQASKSFEDLAKSFNDTDKQAVDLRKEIKALKADLYTLTPGTEEYAKTLQNLGLKMNQLGDTQRQLKAATGGLDTVFETTTRATAAMTGGFQAAMGVVTLFGGKSEDLQKAFVKLQAVMSITTGLKGFAAFPKYAKDAVISLKTYVSQVKLSVKATYQQVAANNTLSTSNKALIVTTNGVKTAFQSLKTALASNPIGLVLIALGGLIALGSKVVSMYKEGTEEMDKYNNSTGRAKERTGDLVDVIKQENEELATQLDLMGKLNVPQEEQRRREIEKLTEDEQRLTAEIAKQEKKIKDLTAAYEATPEIAFLTPAYLADDYKYLNKLNGELEVTRQRLKALGQEIENSKLDTALSDLKDEYRIKMAGGLATEADYINAQIKEYQKAYDALWTRDMWLPQNKIKGDTKEERDMNTALAARYQAAIKALEVNLAVYYAGVNKTARDANKQLKKSQEEALKELQASLKQGNDDIYNTVDEFDSLMKEIFEDAASLGFDENQMTGIVRNSLGNVLLEIDKFKSDWLKKAQEMKDAGEISAEGLSEFTTKLEEYVNTLRNLATHTTGDIELTDFAVALNNNLLRTVNDFKQGLSLIDRMQKDGLISTEQYQKLFLETVTNFKTALAEDKDEVEEYIKGIESGELLDVPDAFTKELENGEVISMTLREFLEDQNLTVEEYINMLRSLTAQSSKLLPPELAKQVTDQISSMIDKEFDAIENKFDQRKGMLERSINADNLSWIEGGQNTSYFGDSPLKSFRKMQEQSDATYNLLHSQYTEEMQFLQDKMKLLDENSEAYAKYMNDLNILRQADADAQAAYEAESLANARQHGQNIIAVSQEFLGSIGNLASAMGNYYAEQAEQAKETYGESSEEYRKYIEKEGDMKIAQVWSDAAMGIMTAWATSESLGPILGPVMAAIQTAALIATATASTQQIRRQTKSTASGNAPANVGQLTDRVIMADAQRTDQTAQLNAQYNQGATRVYVTQGDIQDANNENRVAVTQNKF